MDFLEVLAKRQSVRKFQSRPVEENKVQKILAAVSSAPSAGNLQAYQVHVVKDRQAKISLANAAFGQDFVAQAPLVLVFLADPSRSAQKYGQRGLQLYSLQDATIAATFAWLAAVNQGLSGVWVGAFDDEQVLAILNAPKKLVPIAILPIGYPAESPTKTPRLSLSQLTKQI